jgi:two-component system sensor kinase FixL
MNWVETVWIGMCAASLALGAIHLFVWFKQKTGYAHLLFFALAVSATAFGAFELAMMRSLSPASYATALRWAHVPLALFVLSMIWFVYFHFGAGRLWLALAACGLRLAGLALNFVTGVNVNFREVSSMDPVTFWGGAVVSGPVGVANPWAIVPQMGNLLLVAFVVDAAVTLWRRGGADARRRAAVVGGSLVVCIAAVAGFAALITLGLVHGLTIVMPGVFIVVVAMGYELGWDMIMAAQLATQLRASEQRFRAVVEAVPSAILVVDEQGLITLANQQAEAMFGYPRAELIGQAMDRLIPERFQRPVADRPSPWVAGPQGEAVGTGPDLLARRKDGREFPVEAMLAPLQTGNGAFVLASVLDITERRRLEQATARQRDELAHLSRVAMLGELSGSLAHELNQPLTAILSNAQAAQRFMALSPPRIDKLPEILSRHRQGRSPGRCGDPAAARDAAQGRADAPGGRSQRPGRGLDAAAAQRPAGPTRAGPARSGSGPATGGGRPQPVATGVAEPGAERLRRHGGPGHRPPPDGSHAAERSGPGRGERVRSRPRNPRGGS